MGVAGLDPAICQTPLDPNTGIGYVPYGTLNVFDKFCMPNINKLPP